MRDIISSKRALCAVAIFAAAFFQPPAIAQDFPSKPIHIVVGFAPGGITDIMARWIGEAITAATSQTVVVENRSGAGGNIAASTVAKSPADGYTLLMATSSHVTNRALYSDLSYHPLEDFRGVSLVASAPFVLVANPSFEGESVADVVRMSKDEPGSLDYATSGIGSSNHLTAEQFARIAGFDWSHVAYRGGSPAAMAVMGGELPLGLLSSSQALPLVREGNLKALGISSKARLPSAPEVATFDEQGTQDYVGGTWFGLLAPAGTPDAVVERLHAIISADLDTDEAKARYAGRDAEIVNSSPGEFDEIMQEEDASWYPLIKELGIQIN